MSGRRLPAAGSAAPMRRRPARPRPARPRRPSPNRARLCLQSWPQAPGAQPAQPPRRLPRPPRSRRLRPAERIWHGAAILPPGPIARTRLSTGRTISRPMPAAPPAPTNMRKGKSGDRNSLGSIRPTRIMGRRSGRRRFPLAGRTRKVPPPVAIGWGALTLFLVFLSAFVALAPSTVVSILPGASRLYSWDRRLSISIRMCNFRGTPPTRIR